MKSIGGILVDGLRLCYVDGHWAYFTSTSLDKQWGDDWNDAPYEHNAGRPYQYDPTIESDRNKGPWFIVKVAWDGPFETPSDAYNNSPFSVQDINAGAIAWLRCLAQKVFIQAGVDPNTFIQKIKQCGGNVYLPYGFEP